MLIPREDRQALMLNTVSCSPLASDDACSLPSAGTGSGWLGLPAFAPGLRVLLVDDEPMVAETVGEMLERMGLEVKVTRSGVEALEWFLQQREAVDLVILDMIMPRMGGAEVFRRLKMIAPDVRVVLSSGYSLFGEAQQVMDEGAAGFLQKPYGMKALHQALCAVLPLGCGA